jgi:hypothetical protein
VAADVMKQRKWPVPGDTPLDRARRIATTYRNALTQHDPHQAAILDKRFTELGEAWVVPQPAALDLDAYLGAAAMSEYLGGDPQPGTIRQWAQRGHITRHTNDAGRTVYRVGDILDYLARLRRARAARHTA